MDIRQIIDAVFLAKADDVIAIQEAVQNAMSRFDVDSGVDRLMFINNYGHLMGFPSRPGTSSTVTTGVPTNGIAGFAPGANFYNYKGGAGTAFYVNIGTNLSSNWINVA